MVFIRKKRIKDQEYAYLVSNIWTKKGPRQQTVRYLGKVYIPIKLKNYDFSDMLGKDLEGYLKGARPGRILSDLVMFDLINHGFKPESEDKVLWENGDVEVNLVEKTILSKSKKKPIVIQMNEGFLCHETMQDLFKIRLKVSDDEENMKGLGLELASSILGRD